MQTLFIYKNTREKFDVSDLEKKIADIDGVYDLKAANLSSSPLAFRYEFDDDWVTVRLSDNLETITVKGISKATIQFIIEIKKVINQHLRIFDDGYTFHFSLQNISSLKELERKIQEDYFDEEALAIEAESSAV